jgi:hypothetical protein
MPKMQPVAGLSVTASALLTTARTRCRSAVTSEWGLVRGAPPTFRDVLALVADAIYARLEQDRLMRVERTEMFQRRRLRDYKEAFVQFLG